MIERRLFENKVSYGLEDPYTIYDGEDVQVEVKRD